MRRLQLGIDVLAGDGGVSTFQAITMNGGEIRKTMPACSEERFALREFLTRRPPDYAFLLRRPASIDASPLERAGLAPTPFHRAANRKHRSPTWAGFLFDRQ